jgi:hypothetical protein
MCKENAMEYPYFKITSDRTANSKLSVEREFDLCVLWLDHFKRLGIPACIARSVDDAGHVVYNVWREGVEYTDNKTEPNAEKLAGNIVKSVLKFKERYGPVVRKIA